MTGRIEITLEQIRECSDWQEVFADEGSCGTSVNKTIDRAPPNSEVSIEPMTRNDVQAVIASVNGDNGDDWLGVFLLVDGRYLIAGGWCDFTGWG